MTQKSGSKGDSSGESKNRARHSVPRPGDQGGGSTEFQDGSEQTVHEPERPGANGAERRPQGRQPKP
jgi:hypothetical protein